MPALIRALVAGLALASLVACGAGEISTATPVVPTVAAASVQLPATPTEVQATATPHPAPGQAMAQTATPVLPTPAPAHTPVPAPSLGPGLHDFTLPDAHGGTVTLSQYLGKKTVVLTFYRAWW